MIVCSRAFQEDSDMLKRLDLKYTIDDGQDVLTRIDKVGQQFRNQNLTFDEISDGLKLSKDL